MRRRHFGAALVGLVALTWGGLVQADLLDIYDIQYNTSDGDATIYDGQIHDVTGGIVTHISGGGRPRVWLQDPSFPEWGAIVIKDWEGGELANNVAVGDWVSLESIVIEEFRGTTMLQYNRDWSADVAFAKESEGNPVPDPVLLTAADLAVPVNHGASEPHESMVARLESVVVGGLDLGKASDNYELLQGTDTAWGTDYLNVDAGGPYHPYIFSGAELESITGLIEQYTVDEWDYYQLLTRSTADIVPVPEPNMLVLLGAGLVVAVRRRR
jgi:hypothetical protein